MNIKTRRILFMIALMSAGAITFSETVFFAARDAVAAYLRGGMPDDALIVSAGSVSLGPIAFGGATIPVEFADEFRSDPRVRRIEVEEALTVPARVSGSLFGHQYGTDVAVIGLEKTDWFAANVPQEEWIATRPLPVVAPRIFLTAYNTSFAPAHGLPQLTPEAFVGRTFTFEGGASSLGMSSRGSEAIPATIVGFTDRTDIMGVIVPLEFVRAMNGRLGSGTETRRFIVFAHDPAGAESLAKDLRGKRYAVSAPSEKLRNLRLIDSTVGATVIIGTLLMGTIAAGASLLGAMAHIMERRPEADLYHQLGLSRTEIIHRFVRDLVGPAWIGAILGSGLATVLSFAAIHYASSFFAIAAGINFLMPGLGIVVPALAATIGAWIGGRQVIPKWTDR